MILKVNGKAYDFFSEIKVDLKYNSVASTFEFKGYFDPFNSEHRAVYHPLRYSNVTVDHEGERLITGTSLSNSFSVSSVKELTTISGYSRPGVLADCNIPTSLYPLQSDGLTLREIATKLIKPFGISLVVSSNVAKEVDSVFDSSTASETQTVLGYLNELAAQKDIIIGHTSGGSLLMTRAIQSSPIALFNEGAPGIKMSLVTSGQQMHSEITVQKQAAVEGDNAAEGSINNPFVSRFRPSVKSQSSGDDNDTSLAIQRALAQELKNIKLKIETDRWEWLAHGRNKEIMRPNNIIGITAPNLFLRRKTLFFVESVSLSGNAKDQRATLNCVLPEVYNGKTPRNIF